MEKSKPVIAIEYDDMSLSNPAFSEAWDVLESLRETYPGFKVTFYLVPAELRYQTRGNLDNPELKIRLDVLKKAQADGWVEYCLHGLTHLPSEFGTLDYESAKKRIWIAENKLLQPMDVKCQKIFKAPNWALSKEAKRAVEDAGYKVVEDNYYQWNLRDDLPKLQEFKGQTIIAHGHVQNGDGCDNGVCETASKLRELPEGTEFKFISEVI